MIDPIINSIFLVPTTAHELIKIFSKFVPKSSCGFDNIPIKVFKQIMPHISYPLSFILNKCLSQGIFPNLLKIARVIPIFKNGVINDPKTITQYHYYLIFVKY